LSRALKWCHLSWPSILSRCNIHRWHPPQARTWFSFHRIIVRRCRFVQWINRVKAHRMNYNTYCKLQSSLSLSTEVIMIFCESSRWSPKKRICCVCCQMIIPMTLLSVQHRSYTRFYTVTRKGISTWKKFLRKVNSWNGICLNLRTVYVLLFIWSSNWRYGPKYHLIHGHENEFTMSRTQNRSWAKVQA
jgi:hypothetical protein